METSPAMRQCDLSLGVSDNVTQLTFADPASSYQQTNAPGKNRN